MSAIQEAGNGISLSLTKEFLQDLAIVQVLCQVIHNDPLSHQNIIDPVDQELEITEQDSRFNTTLINNVIITDYLGQKLK